MSPPAGPVRPRVLIADPDPVTRRMLRLGLELDGAEVVEADTVEEAVAQAEQGVGLAEHGLSGVAVDIHIGAGIDPIPGGRSWRDVVAAVGAARVVVLVTSPDELELPPEITGVTKSDFPAVMSALALPAPGGRRLAVVELLHEEAAEVEADWRELCLWDPMLPPDSQPPIASAVIGAVAEAMGRPQPLGWGADPEIEKVAEVYARAVGVIDAAIGQLVCLRAVMRRRVASRIPADEWAETDDRLHMVIDRAIAVAASRAAERLEEEAFLDPLTGLMNRRALERDLRREAGRAARYGRRFGIVAIDLDGLKKINDLEGHAAGDGRLCDLADAVRVSLRVGDAAYRVGGDEFVMLLPEIDDAPIESVMDRVVSSGAPLFSWGAAMFPDEGDDLDALLHCADLRLYDRRRQERGTTDRE